jgi:penicillin-binding protein 1A
LDAPKQTAGNQALRRALIDYEKRHGFTGAIGYVDIDDALAEAIPGGQHQESDNDDALADGSEPPSSPGEAVLAALEKYAAYGNLYPAAVVSVVDDRAHLLLKDGRWGEVRLEDSLWARERLAIDKVGPELAGLGDVLGVGDVVYLEATEEADAFLLSQLPGIEGALVSVDPRSGAVLALVGGFDFHRSKFNRVTQARRQPGSNFKPFIYSAAMEFGDTAATIYNDAPVVFHDSALEGEWRPENYSGRFFGPTRLREALVKSRNLVSIRVLRRLGFRRTLNYVERFGFESSSLPTDLSLALGSGAVSPWQLVTAYSVFANQGYLVAPHFIDRIEDAWGKPVFLAPEVQLCDAACQADAETAESEEADDVSEAVPESLLSVGVDQPALNVSTETQMVADVDPSMGEDVKPLLERDVYKAPLVIDERNAYIMNSIMREVITRGTARKAKVLKRSDVAGKTGTTNDQHDAWFSGFTNQVATSVWLGYDELAPLGARETGGQAALPMWIDYMSQALQGTPEDLPSQPPELVTVRIDRKTGELTTGRNPASMFEFFRVEMAPQNLARQTAPAAPGHQRAGVAGRREPALENEEPLF